MPLLSLYQCDLLGLFPLLRVKGLFQIQLTFVKLEDLDLVVISASCKSKGVLVRNFAEK